MIAYLAMAALLSQPEAAPPASMTPAAPAETRSSVFQPRVDHHLHLLSPAAAELATPPIRPRIELPPELAELVARRAAAWNDQEALADLYTDDSLFFRGGTTGWAQGRAASAGHARWTISDTRYGIKPTLYSTQDDSALVAGHLFEDDGTGRIFGSVIFALRKTPSGWRIAAENYVYEGNMVFETPYTAEMLIARMDAAGLERGVVLSNAYYFDAVRPEAVPDAYAKVRAENDWTADQVALYPDRLTAFCSFNVLRDYALAELTRCADSGRFRGLKLHFNAAQFRYQNPAHVARARAVLQEANRRGLPIIIHLRSTPAYGRADAEVLLRELLPADPAVPVQIAHLWGGENVSLDALEVYAAAVERGDAAARALYFDISGVVRYASPDDLTTIAGQMRRIGLDRILYGSDAPPAEALKEMRDKLPLTEVEFSRLAGNVAPYMTRP